HRSDGMWGTRARQRAPGAANVVSAPKFLCKRLTSGETMVTYGSPWGELARMDPMSIRQDVERSRVVPWNLRLRDGRARAAAAPAAVSRCVPGWDRAQPGFPGPLLAGLPAGRLRAPGAGRDGGAGAQPAGHGDAARDVPSRPHGRDGWTEPDPHPGIAAGICAAFGEGAGDRDGGVPGAVEPGRVRRRSGARSGRIPGRGRAVGDARTMMAPDTRHVPVMLNEVLAALNVRPGGRYLDCTLGGGGHAEAILERAQPGGTLVGIDADAAAIERSRERLARFGEAFRAVQGNFRDMGAICRQLEFAPVNGVLMDLGLSSDQLAEGAGFSFRQETPLDMRFGGEGVTAEEIVNTYSERELADLIHQYGEDPAARRIARRIVQARPLRTSADLAK